FETKVRPLLSTRCYPCHSTQAGKRRGGLLLDTGSSLHRGGDSGSALVRDKANESLLIRAVRYNDSQLHMPPSGKLPAAEIAILEEWVQRGAPFPGSAVAGAGKTIDLVEGR